MVIGRRIVRMFAAAVALTAASPGGPKRAKLSLAESRRRWPCPLPWHNPRSATLPAG
jgi:hypothetical protein